MRLHGVTTSRYMQSLIGASKNLLHDLKPDTENCQFLVEHRGAIGKGGNAPVEYSASHTALELSFDRFPMSSLSLPVPTLLGERKKLID